MKQGALRGAFFVCAICAWPDGLTQASPSSAPPQAIRADTASSAAVPGETRGGRQCLSGCVVTHAPPGCGMRGCEAACPRLVRRTEMPGPSCRVGSGPVDQRLSRMWGASRGEANRPGPSGPRRACSGASASCRLSGEDFLPPKDISARKEENHTCGPARGKLFQQRCAACALSCLPAGCGIFVPGGVARNRRFALAAGPCCAK
jgi:hypothetical protein